MAIAVESVYEIALFFSFFVFRGEYSLLQRSCCKQVRFDFSSIKVAFTEAALIGTESFFTFKFQVLSFMDISLVYNKG